MSNVQDQLTVYLKDAHAIEEQALQQLRVAPDIAGDPEIGTLFAYHLVETESQEALVGRRLEARGAKPSKVKDAVMRAGGSGFILFARSQPDTPGKLVSHAYSFEHLELAAYRLLAHVAERAGDADTVETAQHIGSEEAAMARRIEGVFDRAVDVSLAAARSDDLGDLVVTYLADAHAIEAQALQLLAKAPDIAGSRELEATYSEHRHETEAQQALVRKRLDALGGGPSAIKDAGLRLGALNWGAFFQAQPDTPGKLAAFAYAFEHLEIAGYEQLARVARRAGDEDTVAACEVILAQERSAAERISASFESAADASLEARGVTV